MVGVPVIMPVELVSIPVQVIPLVAIVKVAPASAIKLSHVIAAVKVSVDEAEHSILFQVIAAVGV